MFEDDDYSFNEDEVMSEQETSYLDDVKLKVLDNIVDTCKKIKDNIKLNEESSKKNNCALLLDNFQLFSTLFNIDEENLSEEEIEDLVNEVIKRITKLSYSNMDKILPREDVEPEGEPDDNDSAPAGNAFGW